MILRDQKHNIKSYLPYMIMIGLLCCYGIFTLWSKMLYQTPDGLVTHSPTVWADWVVHITQINTFLDWPLSYWLNNTPFVSDVNFRYPPLANLFGALLITTGLNLTQAMIFSSFIMSMVLLAALLVFYQRFTHSTNWAVLGIVLFLFNGGLGFWYVITQNSESATHIAEQGIIIQNFIISEFLPQRAILFSAPFLIAALILIQTIIKSTDNLINTSNIIGIALLSNVILLSSIHSYLTLVILCAFTSLQTLQLKRQWILIAISCGLTNIGLYLSYYGINDTSGFITFQPGELINYSKLNSLTFFFLNYGLVIPVFIYSFIKFRYWKEPIVVSGMGLMITAYLLQFQPWIWDNTKIITWAYLVLLIPCISFIRHLWQQGQIFKRILAVAFILSATLSGMYDIWNISKPAARSYTLFSQEAQEISREFKLLSSYDTMTLTHMGHNNWVHALAARPVYKAYTGWLWSWGVKLDQIDNELNQMLSGDTKLLKKNKIKYIAINVHHEKNKINQEFLNTFKLVLTSNNFRVYETGF